jgi:hypothetical protein
MPKDLHVSNFWLLKHHNTFIQIIIIVLLWLLLVLLLVLAGTVMDPCILSQIAFLKNCTDNSVSTYLGGSGCNVGSPQG